MKITRDVVRDLWPLYAANEVTPDTRALVEEFLRGDPELEAQLRKALALELDATSAPTPPELAERKALTMTKQSLRKERQFLVAGIVLAAIPPSITEAHLHFESWGLTSAFAKLPAWENYFALACLAASLASWIAWFSVWRRLRLRGF
jgi:hypothetical protein